MKFYVSCCFLLVLIQGVFAQEDSSKVRDLQEIQVKASYGHEIVFKDAKYFILDFYVGEQGTFLLVNHFRKYFLYSLDSAMNIETKMHLDFHPRSLFEDCFGNVHIMAKDSMYHVIKVERELYFYEVNPIRLYYTFLKNCVAANDSFAAMKSYAYGNQNLVYMALNLETYTRKKIYAIRDSVLERSLENDQAQKNTLAGTEKMGEISSPDEMKAIRSKMDRATFYAQVLNKPIYNPLFIVDDTIYIFDHLNNKVVLFEKENRYIADYPIQHHHSKKWAKEIKVDYGSKQFYSVDRVQGCDYFRLLDITHNAITRQVKITGQAFIGKTMFYKGYVFYTFKEDEDANLNRLYRQKL